MVMPPGPARSVLPEGFAKRLRSTDGDVAGAGVVTAEVGSVTGSGPSVHPLMIAPNPSTTLAIPAALISCEVTPQ
jgi:hypothetical protein